MIELSGLDSLYLSHETTQKDWWAFADNIKPGMNSEEEDKIVRQFVAAIHAFFSEDKRHIDAKIEQNIRSLLDQVRDMDVSQAQKLVSNKFAYYREYHVLAPEELKAAQQVERKQLAELKKQLPFLTHLSLHHVFDFDDYDDENYDAYHFFLRLAELEQVILSLHKYYSSTLFINKKGDFSDSSKEIDDYFQIGTLRLIAAAGISWEQIEQEVAQLNLEDDVLLTLISEDKINTQALQLNLRDDGDEEDSKFIPEAKQILIRKLKEKIIEVKTVKKLLEKNNVAVAMQLDENLKFLDPERCIDYFDLIKPDMSKAEEVVVLKGHEYFLRHVLGEVDKEEIKRRINIFKRVTIDFFKGKDEEEVVTDVKRWKKHWLKIATENK